MHNLLETLGIKQVSVSKNNVIISLNITDAIKQPFGIAHGGINAVMAESAASIGANTYLDARHVAVGLDVHTHHLRPAATGVLVATGKPIRVGRTTQVWQVETRVADELTSFSTVTLAVTVKA